MLERFSALVTMLLIVACEIIQTRSVVQDKRFHMINLSDVVPAKNNQWDMAKLAKDEVPVERIAFDLTSLGIEMNEGI